MADINIEAGENIYQMIQDGGFDLDRVTTFVGPGSGPRWLLASGFDLTLLQNESLGRKYPVLLAGSSAGAMRFAAWAQPDSINIYHNLIDSYTSMRFDRETSPEFVLESLKKVIDDYVEDDAIPFALSNKRYRLAIITARARNIASSEIAAVQKMALGMGFIFNILKRSWLYSFFQRVIFYNSPLPPKFCLDNGYRGEAIRLNAANFKSALMASASIPLVVSGIRDIYGAPKGIYRDGGIVDYHLNQKYAKGKEEVTLLFNHQKRVVPVWFEKRLGFKHTPAENLKNVLMVYPSEEFVGRLPGGKIPDREDFKIFLNDQDTRIGNWRKATKASAHFGELFLELVESGKIRHAIKRI